MFAVVVAPTVVAIAACRSLMYVRPTLRRNPALQVELNLSLVILAFEVASVVVFVFALLMILDMSRF